jgi:hypothetical protein
MSAQSNHLRADCKAGEKRQPRLSTGKGEEEGGGEEEEEKQEEAEEGGEEEEEEDLI